MTPMAEERQCNAVVSIVGFGVRLVGIHEWFIHFFLIGGCSVSPGNVTATTTTIILLLLVNYTAHPARGAYFGSQNNSPLYCGRVREGLMVVEYDDGLRGKWHCCPGIRRSSDAQRLLCDWISLVAIGVESPILVEKNSHIFICGSANMAEEHVRLPRT